MSQKKVKSLRKKLTFRIILISLVILLVAVISSQISSNSSFWKATEESIEKSTSIAFRDVNTVLYIAETLLEATSNDVKFMPYDDYGVMQKYLYNARRPYPFVSEIYIGITATNQYMDGTGYVAAESWVLTQRPYYIGAMATSGIFYQDPYLASTGEIFSSIAVKLLNENNETIGVTVLDLALDTLLNICDDATIPGTSAASFLLDSNKRILVHQNRDFMPRVESGNAVYEDYNTIGVKETAVISQGGGDVPRLVKAIDYDGVEKYICTAVLPGTSWTFGFAVPVADFSAQLNTTSTVAMYTVIIALAVIGIFIASQLLLIRPITPLSHVVDTAKMLAQGRMPMPLSIVTDDELGVLASDFNKFIISTREKVDVLTMMADGDLSTEVKPISEEDVLSNAINRMAENTRELISKISSTSEQVSAGAHQVAAGATVLAQGATMQAASIEVLSASVSQIAEKTMTNAHTAEKTSKLSSSIKDSAEKGSRQMDQMIAAVGEITEASKNISKIIKTIDDIAFQTNILALNAAVEAARAGQHGKGFAVVAEEVRSLASKSADAAKETNDMIQNSMDKAVLGSRIAEDTAASLREIVSGINETSSLVVEITNASEEQSEGISQINIGIDQVAQVVQQNSATAEQSAAASQEMNDQSGILEQLISQFTIGDGSGAHAREKLPPPVRLNRANG